MVTMATMAMVAMMKRSESLSWRKKGLSFDYLIKSLLAAARPLSDESRGKHTLWARRLLYQPKLITDKLVRIGISAHVCGFYTCALTTYQPASSPHRLPEFVWLPHTCAMITCRLFHQPAYQRLRYE